MCVCFLEQPVQSCRFKPAAVCRVVYLWLTQMPGAGAFLNSHARGTYGHVPAQSLVPTGAGRHSRKGPQPPGCCTSSSHGSLLGLHELYGALKCLSMMVLSATKPKVSWAVLSGQLTCASILPGTRQAATAPAEQPTAKCPLAQHQKTRCRGGMDGLADCMS